MVIHECLLHYFAVQRMSLCELWLKIFPLNWLWLKRFLLKLVLCSAGLPSELCYWLVFLLELANVLYRCCEIGTVSLCSYVIWKLQLNCKRTLAHFKQYIKGFCKLVLYILHDNNDEILIFWHFSVIWHIRNRNPLIVHYISNACGGLIK